MAGLYETVALLFPRTGASNAYGDGAFASSATSFACHVTEEPTLKREVLGETGDRGVVLVCEGDPGAAVGDRVSVRGVTYVVAKVVRYFHRDGARAEHVTIGAT